MTRVLAPDWTTDSRVSPPSQATSVRKAGRYESTGVGLPTDSTTDVPSVRLSLSEACARPHRHCTTAASAACKQRRERGEMSGGRILCPAGGGGGPWLTMVPRAQPRPKRPGHRRRPPPARQQRNRGQILNSCSKAGGLRIVFLRVC